MSFGRIILLINILLLFVASVFFVFGEKIELYWYAKKNVGAEKFIYIPTGATLGAITKILEREKILEDTTLFRQLAQQKNYLGKNIVSGKYRIEKYFTYNHLVNTLRAGRGALQVKIHLHNIKNLAELAEKVGLELEPNATAFLEYFSQPLTAEKYGLTSENILTLFLEDTYFFDWNTSPIAFAERMYKEHRNFWNKKRMERAAQLDLSPSQVMILASIVQAEQEFHADEQPIIAGLYINRLRQGMKLQADPTIKFLLKDPSIKRILNKHLTIKHPYNTYQNRGLPPGPINLPNKKAIDAVLYYQKHNYIYMCAMPGYSGKHLFASSYTQHIKNAKEYTQWLDQQKK